MTSRSIDRPFFIPAESTTEAIARIFSLTGADPAGGRGEKRAIVALRDALGLDIDVARTNAVMGSHIAYALDFEWRESYTIRTKVNIHGLNALLEAATEAYHFGSLAKLASRKPPTLSGPMWAAFEPAQSKIEAVNRISSLTGSGPEWLGPGSKEHKSVLINLAKNLAPDLDTSLSKTKLGAALASKFHAPWSDACESTGETISLIGLNTLLAGAERHLGRLGEARNGLFGTPEEEGTALAAALFDGWRSAPQPDGRRRVVWEAKKSIEWMREEGLTRGPNDNEWQGFFWEARGRQLLNSAFAPNPTPPRATYGNTTFDYSLRYVWDLKAHTESWSSPTSGETRKGQSAAPLNDQEAMDTCIDEQGLGFLMVGGNAIPDETGEFVQWHREFKASQGIKSQRSNTGKSRTRKTAFEPLHVEAFFFHNTAALNAAKTAGQITAFAQGRQAPNSTNSSGSTRRLKYNLTVKKARVSSLVIAHREWPIL